MPCTAEKVGVGTGFGGITGQIVVVAWKNAIKITNVASFIAAVLRFLAALENLEMCAEANGVNIDQLRERRAQLQREVEDLRRATGQ